MNERLTEDSTVDNAIQNLRKVQRQSRHAPEQKDLTAWRNELEKAAVGWEVVGRKFTLKAAELREKIKAVDILLGLERGVSSENPTDVSRQGNKMPASDATSAGMLAINPDAPPDLRHTRVLSASFAGHVATGWNRLVHAAHKEAMARLGSLDVVRSFTKSNFIVGRASSGEAKRGFRYVPDLNISIQNVDAEHAWSNTLRLARHLKVEVKVDFEWMQKSDAAFPGEAGRLVWKPA